MRETCGTLSDAVARWSCGGVSVEGGGGAEEAAEAEHTKRAFCRQTATSSGRPLWGAMVREWGVVVSVVVVVVCSPADVQQSRPPRRQQARPALFPAATQSTLVHT